MAGDWSHFRCIGLDAQALENLTLGWPEQHDVEEWSLQQYLLVGLELQGGLCSGVLCVHHKF